MRLMYLFFLVAVTVLIRATLASQLRILTAVTVINVQIKNAGTPFNDPDLKKLKRNSYIENGAYI